MDKTKLVSHFWESQKREEEERKREEEEERYGILWVCMETICVWMAMIFVWICMDFGLLYGY